jgi:hypothetical protein
MPSLQQKSHRLPESKNFKKFVPVKGNVDIEFFIVSDESLQQLKEYSNGSTKFDISLFLFALAAGLVTTIVTTDIKSKFIFAALISIASISFVIGIFKYIEFIKSRKQISTILNRIRKNKCDLA